MAEKTTKSAREKEEQYFAEQELKKRKALREKLDAQRAAKKEEQARGPHWMKCPKCGGDLEEIKHEDVMIDKCKGCQGIYLDAGELELLIQGARRSKGFFSKFMEALGAPGD
jgi:Zn-finger nucleic acid-binding protein